MQIVDLPDIAALAVENLDAMALAVGDINQPIGIAADIMRQIELARPSARLAPAEQQDGACSPSSSDPIATVTAPAEPQGGARGLSSFGRWVGVVMLGLSGSAPA